MIDIRINNKSLDLEPGFALTLTRTSNIFEFDTWQGDVSTQFNVPDSPNNAILLENPGDLRSPYYFKFVSCQIFTGGNNLLYTGSLVVTEASEDGYTCHFVVGLGEFARATLNKPLRGDYFNGDKTVDNTQRVYDSDVDEWALFPVVNPDFGASIYGDENGPMQTAVGIQNRRNASTGNFYTGADDFNFTILTKTHRANYIITPFPYVAYVLEAVFLHFGYNVEENYLRTDDELKTLTVYNNFDIHNFTYSYTTTGRLIETNRRSTDQANRQMRTSTWTRSANTFRIEECLPSVSIHEFMFAIANTFNLTYHFDDWRNVRILRRQNILNDTSFTDITKKTEKGSFELEYTEQYDGFYIKHTPASATKETQTFQDIETFIDRYRENIADVNALPLLTNEEIGEIVYSEAEDWFYRYRGAVEDVSGVFRRQMAWTGHERGFHCSYINGTTTSLSYLLDRWGNKALREGFVEGSVELFTVDMKTASFVNSELTDMIANDEWNIATEVEGAERDNDKSVVLNDILLMLHRDNQVAASLYDVVTGYSDIYDENDVAIPGLTFALRVDQDEGLYKKFFSDYLFWWIEGKKEATANMQPDLTFIKKLDFTKKYRIGELNFFIKEIQLSFTEDGVGVAGLELYTATPAPLPIVV